MTNFALAGLNTFMFFITYRCAEYSNPKNTNIKISNTITNIGYISPNIKSRIKYLKNLFSTTTLGIVYLVSNGKLFFLIKKKTQKDTMVDSLKRQQIFKHQVTLHGKFPNKKKNNNNGTGSLFFGPPIAGKCEPCLVKALFFGGAQNKIPFQGGK